MIRMFNEEQIERTNSNCPVGILYPTRNDAQAAYTELATASGDLELDLVKPSSAGTITSPGPVPTCNVRNHVSFYLRLELKLEKLFRWTGVGVGQLLGPILRTLTAVLRRTRDDRATEPQQSGEVRNTATPRPVWVFSAAARSIGTG